jgi:hypothetical protein
MNTPKHSLNIEQPRYDTHPSMTAQERHIVPGYLREKIALAAGQRIVRDAVEHRAIDLRTFTPQETIFPNINEQEQLPQTD